MGNENLIRVLEAKQCRNVLRAHPYAICVANRRSIKGRWLGRAEPNRNHHSTRNGFLIREAQR